MKRRSQLKSTNEAGKGNGSRFSYLNNVLDVEYKALPGDEGINGIQHHAPYVEPYPRSNYRWKMKTMFRNVFSRTLFFTILYSVLVIYFAAFTALKGIRLVR